MNRTRVLRVGRKAVARQGGKGESPKGREENGQGAWGFPLKELIYLEEPPGLPRTPGSPLVQWTIPPSPWRPLHEVALTVMYSLYSLPPKARLE